VVYVSQYSKVPYIIIFVLVFIVIAIAIILAAFLFIRKKMKNKEPTRQ